MQNKERRSATVSRRSATTALQRTIRVRTGLRVGYNGSDAYGCLCQDSRGIPTIPCPCPVPEESRLSLGINKRDLKWL